jgi:hypothetical protein
LLRIPLFALGIENMPPENSENSLQHIFVKSLSA